MEELIFFGVIIAFSIIESIARSRKAKAGGVPVEGQPDGWQGEWELASEGRRADAPSYAVEPVSEEEPVPARAPSQTVLPGTLLDELTALAGRLEDTKARTLKISTQSSARPARPASPALARSASWTQGVDEAASKDHGSHSIHRSHAGYGTDPSQRAKSAQDGLDPLAEVMSRDVATVRRQLLGHGAHSLRQAIILQELLGPPAALRGPPHEI